MKILNEYVVGTAMLLIGGAFFSPRFADILVYPLGTVPTMLPLIGGTQLTVGRVLGIIPLSIGISVLVGKIFSTSIPVVKDIADSSLSAMGEGAIEGAFGAEGAMTTEEKFVEKTITNSKAKKGKRTKMSTDTSKAKGDFKPWQKAKKSKKAEGGSWMGAVSKARKELGIKGFSPIKKGTPLYIRAKEIHSA
jgi:hypothetical protein|tara:strand:+ start:278 stop:853 length:576 start_codon:yes stop_codon:yes gene_type:complete